MSPPTKIPNAFVIVFSLIVLAAALTWFIPGGSFERQVQEIDGVRRELVARESFAFKPAVAQSWQVFTAPLEGFLRFAEIIAFILIVGGAFFVLGETGTIAAGTARLAQTLKGREYLVIPIVMTFFSLFGAVFGMCEEAIPFVMIFVPLALALGYDSIVGVSLTFLAAGVGFAGAFLNPFTLQIAQRIALVPPGSGLGYRLVVWAIATAFTITWVMIYAARIKKDPTRSPMYEADQARRAAMRENNAEVGPFTPRHKLSFLVLLATIVAMIVGVVSWGWYITEIGALFLAMAVLVGLVSRMGPNAIAIAFTKGATEMVGAALIVGFAGGILVILENGQILDTLLYGMSTLTSRMPPVIAAHMMYGVQMGLNFFIPSGSTKAAITMPLMAPLADLSGITRQTAVLAYQFGDGFTNMIIPTSGVTMATLSMAKIPYEKWFKWNLPMQGAFFVFALLMLVWPVLSGWM